MTVQQVGCLPFTLLTQVQFPHMISGACWDIIPQCSTARNNPLAPWDVIQANKKFAQPTF